MADAYTTLGVNRNATEDEIKKAYKKLASKHHPDRGGDTAKFQEIQTAYDTLSDPVKRQQHDNPNPFGFDHGGQGNHFEFRFGGGGPEDIFEQFFGGGSPFRQQRRQARRNKDLRVSLAITLSETLQNSTKTIQVKTTKGEKFTVDVKIPRGVATGTTIKFSQQGDDFFGSLPRGDLYVIINVVPNEKFEIHGNNLITDLDIDCFDAMLGTEREVTGLDGRVFMVKVPAGTQPGAKFGLQGQGLFAMNTPHRGDLIVNVKVHVPKLTEEQKQQLDRIRDQN